MVKLPPASIPRLYAELMEEIKIRLDAVQEAIHISNETRSLPSGYLSAEFAYLQTRRVTELVALAVLVAHNEVEDFRTDKFTKEWNADAIFARLTDLNDEGFPKAFVVTGTSTGPGVSQPDYVDLLVKTKGYLTKAGLTKIYHDCGRQLHAGTLKNLIQKARRYEIGEIQDWRKEIMRLLNDHVVFLPEMKRTMIVHMAHAPEGNVKCFIRSLVSEPPAKGETHITRRFRSEA